MLTTRLKKRDLFNEVNEKKRAEARVVLNEAVRNLIAGMAAAEYDGTLTRDEIENFVLARMGYYETYFYGMDPEEFEYYLNVELGGGDDAD